MNLAERAAPKLIQKAKRHNVGDLVAIFEDEGEDGAFIGLITKCLPPVVSSDIWLYEITWSDDENDYFPAEAVDEFKIVLAELRKEWYNARVV